MREIKSTERLRLMTKAKGASPIAAVQKAAATAKKTFQNVQAKLTVVFIFPAMLFHTVVAISGCALLMVLSILIHNALHVQRSLLTRRHLMAAWRRRWEGQCCCLLVNMLPRVGPWDFSAFFFQVALARKRNTMHWWGCGELVPIKLTT